jgi:hypothetical protein
MDTSAAEALELLPNPTKYVQVPIALVDAIGLPQAYLLSRVHWRFEGGWRSLHERDGQHWWQATLTDLREETGLTVKQVRGALEGLIERDIIVREKHHLGGYSDHSYSYRVRTAQEARALLSTDVPQRANQENSDVPQRANQANTDVPQRADRIAPEGKSSSVKTLHNLLNADSVDADDEPVDKSGAFHLTERRVKLVTDAMTEAGQAHAVPAYLEHLQTVDWQTGEELIRRWCGVQAAVRNGERFPEKRAEVNELLALAGVPPVTEEEWAAFVRNTAKEKLGHGPACHDAGSGWCVEHALRIEPSSLLDPRPWLHEQAPVLDGNKRVMFTPEPERRADGGIDNAIWDPREGYEQDMGKYPTSP